MCGLAGLFVAGGGNREALIGHATRMGDQLAHRGPDDAGTWCDPASGVAFGFRRLSIIDLSPLGHQPMQSPSGRFTMMFNGEVFNSARLAEELSTRGCTFRGHSDTEVMLTAFEQWGIVAAVQRFIGMFAIALWDAENRTLHLIRDRLGVKPLYVHQARGTVAFGSELKALVVSPEFTRAVDPAALRAYLRFAYVPAPLAIYQGSRKLLPGTILSIRDPRAPLAADVPYWSAREIQRTQPPSDPSRTFGQTVSAAHDLLKDAVDLRAAHADVPVGAFLSGGIDSSTVVALMQTGATRPVRTYTISFGEADYDESPHAEAVARHLGTAHTALRLAPADALSVVPQLADVYDEPFADISQVPTLLVSRLARTEVTVALSGDGGDEVFGGYNRYSWGGTLYRALQPVPRPVRRTIGAAVRAVTPATWDRAFGLVGPALPARWRYRLPGEKIHKLGALLHAETSGEFYGALVTGWGSPGLGGDGASEGDGVFEAVMSNDVPKDISERMMLTDLLTYLPDNNLCKVDRASMAASLEVRTPLLDHRVVEFALGLPIAMRVQTGQSKAILRHVLYRYVPRELVDREKMGFDVPIGQWLRGPLRGWADALLSGGGDESGLDPAMVGRVWREHCEGRANHGGALWTLLMWQAWRERWMS